MDIERPTPKVVTTACADFDKEDGDVEIGLRDLFNRFPVNTDLPQVLIKVAALNSLYSTHILAVRGMAAHIHEHGAEIDAKLLTGDPSVIELIGLLEVGPEKKRHYNYCFATKYANWHQPTKFPIWDSRVEHFLYALQKQAGTAYTSFLKKHDDLWVYDNFVRIVNDFRDHFGLQGFTYKDLDKFMYRQSSPTEDELVPSGKLDTIDANSVSPS